MKFSRNLPKIGIYCLLPLLIFVGLLTNGQALVSGINSDLLYIVGLYKDLFVDRYSIRGWNLTPAPYFFPDMVLFFPLLGSMPDIGYAYVLYSVPFFLLLLAILTKIASFLNENFFNCFLCIFSAGLLLVALMQDSNYADLSPLFFFPSLHAGVILIGFTLVGIALNALQKGYSRVSASVFFLLSFLTVASDLIVVTQFFLPLIITTFIFHRLRLIPRRTFLLPTGLMILAHVLASVLLRVLEATGAFNIHLKDISASLHLEKFMDTLHKFLSDMAYYLSATPSLFAIFAIFLITAVVLLFKNWTRLSRHPQDRVTSEDLVLFLIIFSFCSLAITLAVPILTGDWVDRGIMRHMQPLYIFPIFILALIAAHNNRKFGLKLVISAAIVAFSLHQIVPRAMALETAKLKSPYPEKIQCLDKLAQDSNFQYGYSDYWNAKYTTITSRTGMRVNQLQQHLAIYNWINNPNWYSGMLGHGQYPKYQFILTDKLPKADIESRFGQPAIRKECPDTEIYIYNRKSDIAFRNFLRIPATLASQSKLPPSIVSPKGLGKYVPNGEPWNAKGHILIPEKGELPVQFDSAVVSEILEIAADNNDAYAVSFFMNDTLLDRLTVPKMPETGIQARYLPLPESIWRKPFNRLVVRPLQGDGSYSIGHIFLYDDSY